MLREEAVQAFGEPATNVLVTCSVLKRRYRDVFRRVQSRETSVKVRFIFLDANKDLLLHRTQTRQGHYMKQSMVAGQIEALELPQADERDILTVNAFGPLSEVQHLTLEKVEHAM